MRKKLIIDQNLGTIQISDGGIAIGAFHIDEILGIGEVVSDTGPLTDDHYLMFITRKRFWYHVPTNTQGVQALTKFIGSKFNIDSFIQLANVIENRSRMIYPLELEGKEFIKTERIESRNWVERLQMFLGLKDSYRMVVISEVLRKFKFDY